MTAHAAQGPVLVTGVAGFIGSHAAERLIAHGHHVIGVDNFDPYYDIGLKRRNLDEVAQRGRDRFEFVEGDITDAGAMRRVFGRARPSGVIHLAAKAGVRPSIEDPVGYAHANVTGTSVIFAEAARAGCERVVVASSSSVYGNSPTAPFGETLDVNQPISPYAATKRACEIIGHSHWHLTKMPTAMLRFFTVFGPRQRPDLAIRGFLSKISRGERIVMFGDGTTSRDYTFVDDIVTGVLAAYERIGGHGYRVWNLGGSSPTTLKEMIATIGRVVGREPMVDRKPMQPGDVERTWADLSRSEKELGFRPTTGFEEGVRRQWEWMSAR